MLNHVPRLHRCLKCLPPVAILILLQISCDLHASQIRVVATTTMITDAIQQVGGDRVSVEGLMGPGVDPHLYKPAASDVIKLSRGEIIFYNGLLLEGKMATLFSRLSRQGKPVYAVTEGINRSQLIKPENVSGHWDPHVWGDPRLWAECIRNITETLKRHAAEGSATHDRRSKRYLKRLDELNAWGKRNVESIQANKRILITSHDAFNYFGKAFGLKVVGVQGISTVTEAPLADIINIVDFIKTHQIPAIFVESSVSPATINRISEDSGTSVGGELFSDALGTPGLMETHDGRSFDLGTYEGWIGHNIATVVRSLQ